MGAEVRLINLSPSVQFSSIVQSCPTLWDPMDCSMLGFPVHHQLPDLAQTQVNWVSDATQPSHPLLSPSPPALNLSQHQGLFQWVSSSHQVAKVSASVSVLPMNIQDWFSLGLAALIPLRSKGLSRILQHHSSKASILQRSVFLMVQLSHPYTTTVLYIASLQKAGVMHRPTISITHPRLAEACLVKLLLSQLCWLMMILNAFCLPWTKEHYMVRFP